MKKVVIFMISIGLVGCAIGPQTKQELYDSYGYKEIRCLDKPHQEAFKFLYDRMNYCIAGEQDGTAMVSAAPVTWSSSTTIHGEYSPPVSTLAAYTEGGPGHFFYTTVLEVKETDSCPSLLTVYGWSPMNKKNLELIDRWLSGNDDCNI